MIMQALHLITISNEYMPLAGNGKCIVRQYAGKYLQLQVGDHVVMFHTVDAKTQEIIAQTMELLQVSAIAVGTLDTICTYHAARHHEWRLYDEISAFQHHILGFYPVPEEETRDPNAQYCAIYF
jgi:hypothetical protein